MRQSLAATFLESNARLKSANCCFDSNLVSILKTIGDGFGSTEDSYMYTLNSNIQDSLGQRSSREPNESKLSAVHYRFSGFAVNRHPNWAWRGWENAVKLESRLEAHCSIGYALARKGYSLFQVVGRVLGGVQSATNSSEQPAIDGPPEYLVMDPMLFQVRGANHSALIGQRGEAFEEGGSRHPPVRKRRHILNRCTFRVAQ